METFFQSVFLAVGILFVEKANDKGFAALLALDHELELAVKHDLVHVKEEVILQANLGARIFARIEFEVKSRLRLETVLGIDGKALAFATVRIGISAFGHLFVEELVRNYARRFRLSHCCHARTQEDDGRDFQCLLYHMSFPCLLFVLP